jgi:hypothetical protein
LSGCAAREREAGTFRFGNVPGLFWEKTHVFLHRFPPFFLLPPPPFAPTSPPTRQKRVKMPTDGTNKLQANRTMELAQYELRPNLGCITTFNL